MRFRSSFAYVLPFTFLVACGGAETPPAQSPDTEADAAESAPVESEPAGSTDSGEEGWEGESEAKEKPSGADADAPAPAPDTKGEETRTIELIAKLVKEQRKPVRECYENARKDLPDLKGDMVIHFVLDPEGKVKKAELNVERSTLKSPAVADCAIKVIRGIKFPPSSRGMDTTVNYPYNLNP